MNSVRCNINPRIVPPIVDCSTVKIGHLSWLQLHWEPLMVMTRRLSILFRWPLNSIQLIWLSHRQGKSLTLLQSLQRWHWAPNSPNWSLQRKQQSLLWLLEFLIKFLFMLFSRSCNRLQDENVFILITNLISRWGCFTYARGISQFNSLSR